MALRDSIADCSSGHTNAPDFAVCKTSRKKHGLLVSTPNMLKYVVSASQNPKLATPLQSSLFAIVTVSLRKTALPTKNSVDA